MKTTLFFALAALLLALSPVSCSKDDGNSSPSGQKVDPDKHLPDPAGTVTVNLRNESNGKTDLNGIFIDDANNFVGNYDHLYVDLGAMRGLGNITSMVASGNTSKCAVVPGHGYCAYKNCSERTFPSGKYAISYEKAYKLYVDSWILSGASTILGAVVKYVPADPLHGLPANGNNIGRVSATVGEQVTVELPDEFASLPDSEVEVDKEIDFSSFSAVRDGKIVTFTLVNPTSYTSGYNKYYYPGYVYIRVKDFYTRMFISVN